MPSATDRTDLVALVEELVEAHLDTIEMGLEFGHEWAATCSICRRSCARAMRAWLAVAGLLDDRHLAT
jgi:hypothetical protein